MQDRYAGDIGDFGKFGLLSALEITGFRIGINWYKVLPPSSEYKKDGSFKSADGRHRIKEKYYPCDEVLAKKLFAISESGSRSIDALENAMLLKNPIFFHDTVPVDCREQWHRKALDALTDCSLVFLDPDNGLLVKSVKEGSQKSVKYVIDRELSEYIKRGQSVVLYNHRPRKQREQYFAEIAERLNAASIGKPFMAITFPKGSVRDYFLIPANDEHSKHMKTALTDLVSGPWGQLGLCKFE